LTVELPNGPFLSCTLVQAHTLDEAERAVSYVRRLLDVVFADPEVHMSEIERQVTQALATKPDKISGANEMLFVQNRLLLELGPQLTQFIAEHTRLSGECEPVGEANALTASTDGVDSASAPASATAPALGPAPALMQEEELADDIKFIGIDGDVSGPTEADDDSHSKHIDAARTVKFMNLGPNILKSELENFLKDFNV